VRVLNPVVNVGTMEVTCVEVIATGEVVSVVITDVGRVTGADVSAGGGVEVSAVMGVVINAVI